jgi:hypothetical protein
MDVLVLDAGVVGSALAAVSPRSTTHHRTGSACCRRTTVHCGRTAAGYFHGLRFAVPLIDMPVYPTPTSCGGSSRAARWSRGALPGVPRNVLADPMSNERTPAMRRAKRTSSCRPPVLAARLQTRTFAAGLRWDNRRRWLIGDWQSAVRPTRTRTGSSGAGSCWRLRLRADRQASNRAFGWSVSSPLPGKSAVADVIGTPQQNTSPLGSVAWSSAPC